MNTSTFSVRASSKGRTSTHTYLIYKDIFLHEEMSFFDFFDFTQVATVISIREIISIRELPLRSLATSGWKTDFSSV